MKTIHSLSDDIFALLSGGQHTYEHFKAATSKLNIPTPPKRPSKPYLRMSSIGRPCQKQTWYSLHYPELGEELRGSTHLKFQYGHMIEDYILWLAEQSGHTVTHKQYEVQIRGVTGHIDAIIDGVLVDIKTASSFAFKKFKEGGPKSNSEDLFGYRSQLSLYHYALSHKEIINPYEPAYWFVINKENGDLTLCPYKVNYSSKEILFLVSDTKANVENKDKIPSKPSEATPLPDGSSGNLKLPVICSYCSFKKHCWSNLRTFIYSNGPRYLTHVSKEPNVPELKEENVQ